MDQSENRSTVGCSSVARYTTAIGAAIVAAFFDFVRNSDLSAITKTAVSIKALFQITGSTQSASIISLIIFGIIGALLVYIYRPQETKESFLLGLSVLAFAGIGVPPAVPNPAVPNPSTTSSRVGMIPISSAIAQESPQAGPRERRVWIFVEGPGQRQIPELRVMVYSGVNGQLLSNSLMFTKFSLNLPPGTHQIEISRSGFRSVSLKINPTRDNAVYRIPMTNSGLLANFFGPQSISVEEDARLTELVANAVSQCQAKNGEAAANSARQAGINKDKLDRDTRWLLCL